MIEEMEKKEFDCVQTMREIRSRVSAEIVGKTRDELDHWFHAHLYSDPILQRLARRGEERKSS